TLRVLNMKDENGNSILISENPSWDSLPWPPLKRIFTVLRTDGDCIDLSNLLKVSKRFRHNTFEFMRREENRPSVDKVYLSRSYEGRLVVQIDFFPSNLRFHNFSGLDWKRFERPYLNRPILRVMLMR
ncbi:hypothetical protein PMAYCL1PPCAC_27428, partial [Pristionchus mayeri]